MWLRLLLGIMVRFDSRPLVDIQKVHGESSLQRHLDVSKHIYTLITLRSLLGQLMMNNLVYNDRAFQDTGKLLVCFNMSVIQHQGE
jgi:hypothetical protein